MATDNAGAPPDRPGYGRPPKATRFPKGRSGNPKGRPKGAPNLKTDIRDELSERITVREGPVTKKISKQRAIIKSQVNKSIQGDTRAAHFMIELSEKHLPIPPDDNTPLTPDEQAVFDASERRRLRREQAQSGFTPSTAGDAEASSSDRQAGPDQPKEDDPSGNAGAPCPPSARHRQG